MVKERDEGMTGPARIFGLPAAVVFGFLQFVPLAAGEIRRQYCFRSELSCGKLSGGR
ncbi:hypothetical protein [Paenibacillus pedocola]|uniref:hypothetical protein n=1 Tax=Paenibacillus pedocola TaxID=3242193 RepID=UPI002877E34A|nr:hypothetical protein [Paenibacillus typhae]